MALSFVDILGVLGSVLYLYSYVLVQIKRNFAKSIEYSLMNFAAACLVLVSLYQNFNLAAVVCNISWGLISVYGIYRCWAYIEEPLEKLEAVVEEVLTPNDEQANIP